MPWDNGLHGFKPLALRETKPEGPKSRSERGRVQLCRMMRPPAPLPRTCRQVDRLGSDSVRLAAANGSGPVGVKGFVLSPRGWVVERRTDARETMIPIALIHRMSRYLPPKSTP